jgi:hypothetical protein
MHRSRNAYSKGALFRSTWLAAVTALLLAGAAYRVAASRLELIVGNPITLPVPLKALPLSIKSWTGVDVPVDQAVQRVAGTDDFLNRRYLDNATNQRANVYVAYCGRPRTMVGHRPEVCYVAGGWIHDGTEQSQFLSSAGRTVRCLLHRFHKPAPQNDSIVVLSFYIMNGQVTADEGAFSGLGWRTPNIAGNPALYVAQVQLSSVQESAVRAAASDMAQLFLDFFPDESGKVRAAEYITALDVTR